MSDKKTSSGKYASRRRRKSSFGGILAVILVLLAAAMALVLYFGKRTDDAPSASSVQTTQSTAAATEQVQTAPVEEDSVNLGYGVYVTDVGGYTGAYVEDGSDEVLSNILMLVVRNGGEQDIQYARITIDLGDQQASFSLSTLPAGEKMVLLEETRMTWDSAVDYSAFLPKVENIAYFQEPVAMQEDKLEVMIQDGAVNVTNISGEDIPGTITVYYKNAAEDILYGGITYRVLIEGGLKAGEIRQIMTNHASDTGSRIMFVTIGQ